MSKKTTIKIIKKYDNADEYLYEKYGKEFTLVTQDTDTTSAPHIYQDENGNQFNVIEEEFFMDDYGHILFDEKASYGLANKMPVYAKVFVDTTKAYTSASHNATTWQEYLEMVPSTITIYTYDLNRNLDMIKSVIASEISGKAIVTLCEVDEEVIETITSVSDPYNDTDTFEIEDGRIK